MISWTSPADLGILHSILNHLSILHLLPTLQQQSLHEYMQFDITHLCNLIWYNNTTSESYIKAHKEMNMAASISLITKYIECHDCCNSSARLPDWYIRHRDWPLDIYILTYFLSFFLSLLFDDVWCETRYEWLGTWSIFPQSKWNTEHDTEWPHLRASHNLLRETVLTKIMISITQVCPPPFFPSPCLFYLPSGM